MNPDLSIVILSYKSEEIAPEYCKKILSHFDLGNIFIQVFIVNNYDSKKRSLQINDLISTEKISISVIENQKKGGLGWDIKQGFEKCIGKYICLIDGDAQIPADSVSKIYNLIKNSDYEMIKARRIMRQDGFQRIIISRVYEWVFNLLFPCTKKIHDINGKPKIILRDTLIKMNIINDYWFFDAEFMIEICRLGIKFEEIPINFYKNNHRKSLVGFKVCIQFLINLLKYRYFNGKNEQQK